MALTFLAFRQREANLIVVIWLDKGDHVTMATSCYFLRYEMYNIIKLWLMCGVESNWETTGQSHPKAFRV